MTDRYWDEEKIMKSDPDYIDITITYQGSTSTHMDSYDDDSEHIDEEYTAPVVYEKSKIEDKYGYIGIRGKGPQVSRPVDDPATLIEQRSLEAGFHFSNRHIWDEHSDHPNDGTTLFDLKLAEHATMFLAEEGVGPSSDGKYVFIMKYLMMMSIFDYSLDPDDDNELATFRDEYLANLDRVVLEEHGLTDPTEELNGFNLTRIRSKKVSEEDTQKARNAGIRATFGLYRRGIVLPDSVHQKYDLEEVEPPLSEHSGHFPRDLHRAALREKVRHLIDETTGPLSVARKDPTRGIYDTEQYLALFATSALTGVGVRSAPPVLDWHYPEKNIPLAADLTFNIHDRLPISKQTRIASQKDWDLPSINEQFDEIHQKTLAEARSHGLATSPQKLAVDKFTIDWTGRDDVATLESEPKPGTDSTAEWTFLLLAIIGPESRFIIGSRLIEDESNSERATKELLGLLPDDFDIDLLLADAGEISGELLEIFNSIAGPNWLTMAPDRPEIKELIAATPSNAVAYTDGVPYNREPAPRAEVYPYKRFLEKEGNEVKGEDGKTKYHEPVERIRVPMKRLRNDDDALHELHGGNRDLSDYEGDHEPTPHQLVEFIKDKSKQDDPPGVGNNNTHKSFFTDYNIEDRSFSAHNFLYHKRWGIEATIQDLKHYFRPHTQSPNPEVQLYFTNLAILFQNWHTLINRIPNSETRLRLNPTYAEVMKAIQEATLSPNHSQSNPPHE